MGSRLSVTSCLEVGMGSIPAKGIIYQNWTDLLLIQQTTSADLEDTYMCIRKMFCTRFFTVPPFETDCQQSVSINS